MSVMEEILNGHPSNQSLHTSLQIQNPFIHPLYPRSFSHNPLKPVPGSQKKGLIFESHHWWKGGAVIHFQGGDVNPFQYKIPGKTWKTAVAVFFFHQLETSKTSHSCSKEMVLSYGFQVNALVNPFK